jgi:hypothetical protein
MIRIAHVVFGMGLAFALARALGQGWLADELVDQWAVAAIRVGIPTTIAFGSAIAVAVGLRSGNARRAFRDDALSALTALTGVLILALGGLPRDVAGLVFVLVVAARVGPWAWWAVRHGAPPAYVFALAFAFYAPLIGWRVAASLPFGDQVFYLLSAERLAHGTLDATVDPKRFFELLGVAPTPVDTTTHVADAPVGPRLIQGYALPAILVPGWLIGAETGATIVIALFAAWASMQTWLLLSETGPPNAPGALHPERIAWALVTFCAPLALLAVHVYPNPVGAALIVTGYRYAFTARERRPLLAGALLGATAFLNPRDGLVLLVLAPFALAWIRSARVRFALGAVALVVAAALVSFVTFGVALPYAGYIFGTATAQTIQAEPTWNFHFWVGLPAILFDRVFGVAGTAPWLFLAALGAFPALRHARQRLVPAGTAVVVSIALLSLFRLWEGGYAPPNRYLVDVLPLAAPFVAFGLWAARPLVLRVFAAVTIVVSVIATAFLLAVPTAALNTAFDDKPQLMLDAALGLNPLGWLPSFQPVTPDWYVGAYLRLIPCVLLLVVLVVFGWRRRSA